MAICGRWTGTLAALCAGALAGSAAQPLAQPIIDMHMHAMRADDQGPPPLGVCQGDVQPPPEAGRPSSDTFMAWLKKPPCANPIWSPMTDREVMERSLAVMKRRNVFGVVSGVLLDDWQKAAPDRVIPSLDFNFEPPFRTAAVRCLPFLRPAHRRGGLRQACDVWIGPDGLAGDD